MTTALSKLLKTKPFLIYFTVFSLYFAVIWNNQLIKTDNGISAGWLGTWADGAAHLTYTSYLSQHLPQNLPVFAHHPFTYPFAADLLTSFLVKLGLSLFTSYQLIGFLLSLALVILVYLFNAIFLKDSLKATTASIIFFLSGGLGFSWFIKDSLSSGLVTTLSGLPREYTHLVEENVVWINIISGELIPQRSLLLGMVTGLIILIFLWQASFTKLKTRYFLIIGLLLGLMPIVHPHTLIVLSAVLVWVLALKLKQNKFSTDWALLILLSAAIGLPLLATFIIPATNSNFFKFSPGWLASSKNQNWLQFWLINWGLFPVAALAGVLKLNNRQRFFLVPFAVLFILSNLFLFQPYDWDNTKILTWVHLAFSAPAAVFIVNWFKSSQLNKIFASVLFIILIFSGSLDALRLLQFSHTSIPMFTTQDLKLADWVKQNTSSSSVFLTSSKHNHPIPTLTGRQIIMGYPGWLWSYGINYDLRQHQVNQIYSGSNQALKLLSDFNINYVTLDSSEQQLDANQNFFDENFLSVYSSANYTIYQID